MDPNEVNQLDGCKSKAAQIESTSQSTGVSFQSCSRVLVRKKPKEGTQSCVKPVDDRILYEYLQGMGLAYGPASQALRASSYTDDGTATGKIRVF